MTWPYAAGADAPTLVAVGLAWAGAMVAFHRLGLRRAPEPPPRHGGALPFVSIVIPARNEEHNLPPLLESLKKLEYPAYDVTVIDDGSTDRTTEIARSYGVRVMSAPPRPPGWNPKNWACQSAAASLKGGLFLFTDADTVHRPDGLRRAVGYLQTMRADLVSCVPYHLCPTWWERLMGPFHGLVLVATALRQPAFRRLYAAGPFLLFERGFYERSGGHGAVANQYPDDFALANHCLRSGGRFAVSAGEPYVNIRMYASFADFVRGLRRNFQAGLRQTRATAGVEVTLVVAALIAGGRPQAGWPTLVPAALTAGLLLFRQRSWGQFSPLGVLLLPVPLAAHLLVTLLAVWDWLRGGSLQWKARELTRWTASSEEKTMERR